MSNNSNNDNSSEFAPFNEFDIARQKLQFIISAVLANFEARWRTPVGRIRIHRETEDDCGNYTKLSSVTPHDEAPTGYIASVTVEFSPAQLVSPNLIPVFTDKELETVTQTAGRAATTLDKDDLPF